MTNLHDHIQNSPVADTHEHQPTEAALLKNPPDVLQEIFIPCYLTADLRSSGAAPEAIKRLHNPTDPDLAGRFEGVRKAWEACRMTGYGEGARLIARLIYDMDEITPSALEKAQKRNLEMRRPGERLRLFKDVAKVAHMQIDRGDPKCLPDPTDVDFFFNDLSWWPFASAKFTAEQVRLLSGVEVKDIAGLRQALEALVEGTEGRAIAIKTQHAYDRTLEWVERSDAEAEPVLQKLLAGKEISAPERDCLGDWCVARGCELAERHNLPFKFHTGYCARNYEMIANRIRCGHLSSLVTKYQNTRFVFFHTSYPYQAEAPAMAKHFPNVYLDMCWAWCVDPGAAAEFLRRYIHSAPANKLFGFGADTFYPTATVAFAAQMRKWLERALQAEIDEGLMTEPEAIAFATRIMTKNQEEFFDLEGTRAALRKAAQ